MTTLQTIILGIVQGVAEFLPVSSSGHLVLLAKFFQIKENVVLINLILHVGTAMAVICFFWKDILGIIKNKNFVLVKNLALAFLTTSIFAFAFKDIVEKIFIQGENIIPIAWGFAFTAFVLLLIKKIKNNNKDINSLGALEFVKIGLAQAIAIVPGISRSGMTFFAASKSGANKEDAFRFSFLLSIPTILGAAAIETLTSYKEIASGLNIANLMVGLIISFIFGILSLWIFQYLVRQSKLWIFSIYLILLSFFLLVL